MIARDESDESETVDNIVWATGNQRDDYFPETVAKRDALADAARNGDWDRVFEVLEHDKNWINAPRLGSSSGYAPLHQAAWLGRHRPDGMAPITIRELLRLRTLPGRRPRIWHAAATTK